MNGKYVNCINRLHTFLFYLSSGLMLIFALNTLDKTLADNVIKTGQQPSFKPNTSVLIPKHI